MVDSVASPESLCKCCLNQNGLRDMWAGYISTDSGEFEIFGQMLTDCFTLPWAPPEDETLQELICDSCVERLRIAYNFKKEILETNELLIEVGKHTTFKNEAAADSIDEGTLPGEDNEAPKEEAEYYDEEWLTENLKQEPETEQYEEVEYLEEDVSNVAGSSVASDDQKSDYEPTKKKKKDRRYKNYTEAEMKIAIAAIKNKTLTVTRASDKYNIPQNTLRQRMGIDEKGATEDRKLRLGRLLARESLVKILQNCNGTPIRAHWGVGYECSYCPKQFRLAPELKKHTLKCHDPHKEKPFELHPRHNTETTLKVDITSLSCNICETNLSTIETLIKHLNNHGLGITESVQKIILPFKFSDNDILTCAICGVEYKSFKALVIHMTTHFKNYECPYCQRPFVISKKLKLHVKSHEIKIFPCEFCGRDQKSRSRLRDHIRVAHVKKSKTLVCGYCPEKFVNQARKIDHEFEKHNVTKPTFKCKDCEQSFNYQYIFAAHTRKVHLKTPSPTCQECGKVFKTTNNLNGHIMLKHREHKRHPCTVCGKTFSKNNHLKTHMRIHTKDVIYACEYCDMKCVQKNTLKRHVRRKHAHVDKLIS